MDFIEDGDVLFPYPYQLKDYRTEKEFSRWLKTPEGMAAAQEIARNRELVRLRGLLQPLLSDPVGERTLIVPPRFDQADERLAGEWCGNQRENIDTMFSARIAEKAIARYFREAGAKVDDVAMTQLDSPNSGEWEQFDLRVDGSPIDVKNARVWSKHGRRFSAQTVQRFKHTADGTEVQVAGVLSRYFEDPDCEVIAIRGERTFWEKATILHQQAFRKTAIPKGYSRHYYDLVCMAQFPVKDSALADLPLLRDVVRFKEKFYRSPSARYELAVSGSFRLMPTDQGGKELQADYRSMRPMFFSEPPGWDAVLDQLQGLEDEINQL